jgi:hypothetical protein
VIRFTDSSRNPVRIEHHRVRFLPDEEFLEIGHPGKMRESFSLTSPSWRICNPNYAAEVVSRRCSYLAPFNYAPLAALTRVFLGCSLQFRGGV